MTIPQSQAKRLESSLKTYIKTYLNKKYENLDESATRVLINKFLKEVLGLQELEEIKTEYAIKGTYADYIIQIERKKHFVIEVKAMQIDLSENHLRQAVGYAANEGIEWVLLTNGRHFELYKVIFGKPLENRKVFDLDLNKKEDLVKAIDLCYLLSKRGLTSNELTKYWARYSTLEPQNLSKFLYEPEILKFIKKKLKQKSSISFSDEDIIDSVYKIIVEKIPSVKPKLKRLKPAIKPITTS